MSQQLWNAVHSLLKAATRSGTIHSYDPIWDPNADTDAPSHLDVVYTSVNATDCKQLDAEVQAFGFEFTNRTGHCVTYSFDDPSDGGVRDDIGTDSGTGGIDESIVTSIENDPLLTGSGEVRLEQP